jgi:hypothetical protein
MTRGRVAEHHRIRLLLLVLLLLAALGVRALARQQRPVTSAQVRQAADTSSVTRVVVSISARRLWVVTATGDTLRSAPVAVGSGRRLSLGGKSWRFVTPVGVHIIRSIEVDPLWIRPDWAYLELARQRRLKLDSVGPRRPRALANGDSLVVRGGEIGVLHDGAFTAWPSDKDIVIGKVLYLPPLGTPYRAQRGVLGPYRLNLGGSIGLHGTSDTESVGKAVTHGCMRLLDDDVTWLYLNVAVGTPVFIY